MAWVRRVRTASGATAVQIAESVAGRPQTPLDRLLSAQVLAPAQSAELLAYRDSLNPAADRPRDRRPPSRAPQTGQGQDRAARLRDQLHRYAANRCVINPVSKIRG